MRLLLTPEVLDPAPPMDGVPPQLRLALDDLSSRFFLNLPQAELASFERLFFQLEQAWWFYDDFYREPHPDLRLPRFSFRDFCLCLFEQSSALRPHVPNFERHFTQFRDYLSRVPVCGAILLDESMSACVLVRGYNSRTWTFPKGKINQGELHIDCAVREVFEETGVDIADLVSDRHVLQAVVRGKSTNLYLAPNLSRQTGFSTQTRKEIADIRWFAIDELERAEPSRFWSVAPFLYKLKAWIARHGHLAAINQQHQRGGVTQRSATAITFGADESSSWPVEQMFEANARLFGVESEPIADPNQLAALMADRSAMAGTVQWRRASNALKRQQAKPPSSVPEPLQPACADTAAAAQPEAARNVLLSFELDDARIMSHFFQA